MSDLTDIFSGDAPGKQPRKLTEEKLQAYLEGKLSPEEQHEVEQWLAEEGMEDDALEGLKQLDPKDTYQTVSSLNRHLYKQMKERRHSRRKYYEGNRWVVVALLIILLLAVLAYAVIHTMGHVRG